MEFTVIKYIDQTVHGEVVFVGKPLRMHVTFFEGQNKIQARGSLWETLIRKSKGISGSWIILWDFHNVLRKNDRLAGAVVTTKECEGFKSDIGCDSTTRNKNIMMRIFLVQ